MFNGNSNKVMNYLYPGFLEYLRRENTGEYSLEEIKQVFKEHIETASKKNRNTTIRVKINKITKKIQFKKELLYVLNYSLISEKINENISLGGEAIAISSDNGYKWSFFENNEENSKSILSINYPITIVEKLLINKENI